MSQFWMVRAGEGGYLIGDFERTNHVGIGWQEIGDMSAINTLEEMRDKVRTAYPDLHPSALGNSAAMAFKFRSLMKPGDAIVSYDPQTRVYFLGVLDGDYKFDADVMPDHPHVRAVRWNSRISRDLLTATSRNTLGSVLTIFEPGQAVLDDLMKAAKTPVPPDRSESEIEEDEEEFEAIRRDTLSRAHEFIKDRILSLSPEDLEELVAAVLRALGFKARVTAKGPDRGRDVIASPDGLGLQEPRIIAEVKHRPRQQMGASELRSFIGGLRENDRGLYVSTGGFSREGLYEAERASVPMTTVSLDELARLVVEHYENFDAQGRSLVPLVKVYWPTL